MNTTEKIWMVWSLLAQLKANQKCGRHEKYFSYHVKPNTEQLFRCGAEVEKHKAFTLVRGGCQI